MIILQPPKAKRKWAFPTWYDAIRHKQAHANPVLQGPFAKP
jgi:hypothetical protein